VLFCLCGKSASGKSTVEKTIVDEYGVKKITSYTTREPRLGEEDGVDYFFLTNEDFEAKKNQGLFDEVARYNNLNYGLSLKMNNIDIPNEDAIAVVTINGYEQLKEKYGTDLVKLFYFDIDDWIRVTRAKNRGDDVYEVARRVLADREDFKDAKMLADEVIEINEKDSIDFISNVVYNLIKSYNK